jgi:hypothetical protein
MTPHLQAVGERYPDVDVTALKVRPYTYVLMSRRCLQQRTPHASLSRISKSTTQIDFPIILQRQVEEKARASQLPSLWSRLTAASDGDVADVDTSIDVDCAKTVGEGAFSFGFVLDEEAHVS